MKSLYENAQWRVTKAGIECLQPVSYFIEAARLDEITERDQVYYDWPVHLAEKDWVHLSQFFNAFSQAMVLLKDKYDTELDNDMLDRSYKYAAKVRAQG